MASTGARAHENMLAVYDVSVAFFHGRVRNTIYVVPPKEIRATQPLWKLKRALYGTRDAGQIFQDYINTTLSKVGFVRSQVCGCLFHHREKDVWIVHHGDDFLAVVTEESGAWLDGVMKDGFKIKVMPRIGPGGARHGAFLHRTLGWTPEGFYWEHDGKHVERLIARLSLTGRAVTTPGLVSIQPEMHEPLVGDEVHEFRSLAGTAMHLAQDRPEVQYAVKECLRGMAAPTQSHRTAIKRVVKYLMGAPLVRWHFPYQDGPCEIEAYSDSNWAAIESGFRSTSGGWIQHGGHLIESFSATQQVVALSSAEAEYVAMTKTASHALELKHLLEERGLKTTVRLWADSKAA
eukprot:6347305-Amphidinium_carterae.1